MKIRIPACTVEVDAEAWALEYGIEKSEVREDVINYFTSFAAMQIDYLGLGIEEG